MSTQPTDDDGGRQADSSTANGLPTWRERCPFCGAVFHSSHRPHHIREECDAAPRGDRR